MASKNLGDYRDCDEYVPRKQKREKSSAVASEAPEDDLKIESITEEEATKVVISGTHDYPSAPGFPTKVNVYAAGVPLSSENATHKDPSKNSIDQALKSLKSKEQQQKKSLPSLLRVISRQSTSLIAYQPREAHKQSHKAVPFFIFLLIFSPPRLWSCGHAMRRSLSPNGTRHGSCRA